MSIAYYAIGRGPLVSMSLPLAHLQMEWQNEHEASIVMSWQQSRIFFITELTWARPDGVRPEVSEDMRSETLRVAESIIQQGS